MALLLSAARGARIFRRGVALLLLHREDGGNGADKQADDWNLLHYSASPWNRGHILYKPEGLRNQVKLETALN